MIIKLPSTYKGTRIVLGNDKRILINKMIDYLLKIHFNEISIPIIQQQSIFESKVGDENQNMMFNFKDRGDRDLCLAPEYTAVIQQLAKKTFKNEKNVHLFYVQECFRGEKPQEGRYRQFTQLGVEILNTTINKKKDYLSTIAVDLLKLHKDFEVGEDLIYDNKAIRGLDYYKEGSGFEMSIPKLGAQKQVCGGGEYDGGVGFAIGIDRLLLA